MSFLNIEFIISFLSLNFVLFNNPPFLRFRRYIIKVHGAPIKEIRETFFLIFFLFSLLLRKPGLT